MRAKQHFPILRALKGLVLTKRFTVVLAWLILCAAAFGAPGDVDLSFSPGSINTDVYVAAPQPDGKTLIGGAFTNVGGFPRRFIARLLSNGQVDQTFVPETGAFTYDYFFIESIVTQPDGKILMGGSFYDPSIVGYRPTGIARLNTNGTLDTTFQPRVTGVVYSVAAQPDGKLVIGGSFSTVNGTNRNSIARLNNDGTLDTTFDPGSGASSAVFSVALQPDGKVLIGGNFTTVNGAGHSYLARLNTNGVVDTSFYASADYRVYSIAVQSDGYIVLGGWFYTVNSTKAPGVARISPEGFLDIGFTASSELPGGSGTGKVNCITLQSDNKIVVGGAFQYLNGVNRHGIARLNTNGTLDTAFDPGTGITNSAGIPAIYSVALQPDKNILVAGSFTDINGVPRSNVARLFAETAPIPLNMVTSTNSLALSWSDSKFSLQSAPTLESTFTNVPGASSPFTNTFDHDAGFFRLKAD